jgi:hypothetical protein
MMNEANGVQDAGCLVLARGVIRKRKKRQFSKSQSNNSIILVLMKRVSSGLAGR